MTLHPNPTSPPGKAATEGLDSRCGLVGIEGPEKAAVRLFQRARAKPMDARLWSPTGTPFTTSAIKSFFEQEIYKHPTEWWGAFIWLRGRFLSNTQTSSSRFCSGERARSTQKAPICRLFEGITDLNNIMRFIRESSRQTY